MILKGCNIPESVIASIKTDEELDKTTQKEVSIVENNVTISVSGTGNFVFTHFTEDLSVNNIFCYGST